MTHTPAGRGPGTTSPRTTAQSRGRRGRGGLGLVFRTIAGAALMLLGVAMLVLPGPGLLVIVAALSLLAVDYVWARRLRMRATDRLAAAGRTIRRNMLTARRLRHASDQPAEQPATEVPS